MTRLTITSAFEEVWVVDTEFRAPPGEVQEVHCLVARECRSRRLIGLWADELKTMTRPPYDISDRSLFVAYYASAELLSHLALGWALPTRILDPYVEFRVITNGKPLPCGRGLLGAMAYFGVPGVEAVEKESMRRLAMRGGPFTWKERQELLDYCQNDVEGLEALLLRMLPSIDLPRALLRGRYMAAAARIEQAGVPIDEPARKLIFGRWSDIQDRLIQEVDAAYQVYDGQRFRTEAFVRWLQANKVPWPALESGRPALDSDTFKEMARLNRQLASLHDLRQSLSLMKRVRLPVGSDGRNRTLLSPFWTVSGRNQPSPSEFIFGMPAWLRSLIRPRPGFGLSYLDYEQQEFAIGAALSNDPGMAAAYNSGDAYLSFAKQAGAVPPTATKKTHAIIREQFKVACGLGVLFGMQAPGLGVRLGISTARAQELLDLHRRLYPTFWRWSSNLLDHAMLTGRIHTVFGWPLHIGRNPNPRTAKNFPMQANGAEILRLACCLATERGIRVCAPVHDALLIEAPLEELDQAVAVTRGAMEEAGAIVLKGFRLRTEEKRVVYPERFLDPRGVDMWTKVWRLLAELGPTQVDIGGVS